MNWQHLKYFIVVAEEEHFTRAANKLYVTQSTLSKAMENLEQEIGVPLFEKNGRNVKLSSFGKTLKENVSVATHIIDDAMMQINSMAKSEERLIRITSIFSMGINFIPMMIREYMDKYNKINLDYKQDATTAIISNVLNENIDVGFCGDFLYSDQLMSIERQLVQTEELVLIVPEGHPLYGKESIRMADIMDETFIGWNSNTGIVLSIEKTLKEAGFSTNLKYSFMATEDNSVVGLVRQGFGIALIANVSSLHLDGISKIKIADLDMKRHLFMIWKKNKNLSISVRSFIDFILNREAYQ